MTILLLVFMSQIKIDLTLKKSNFLFVLCFKNAIFKFIPNAPAITTEKQFLFLSFYIKCDASNVFTGYDTGCKRSLQL